MIGNLFTAGINLYNQSASPELVEAVAHAGLDEKLGTDDDLTLEDGTIRSHVSAQLDASVAELTEYFNDHGCLPAALNSLPNDPWGNPMSYQILHAKAARVSSLGPDREESSQWDLGVIVKIESKKEKKDETWLDRQKQRQGLVDKVDGSENANPHGSLSCHYYAGGQSRLEGAAYFWFFTKLMFVTSILFIPFAIAYKPKTYLQEDEAE